MKFWKNLPSWLKGGICTLVGLVLYGVILGLLNWMFGGIIPLSEWSGEVIFFIPIKLIQLFPTLASDDIAAVFVIWIIIPLFYFVIGAIIGWIVGKIKKRK